MRTVRKNRFYFSLALGLISLGVDQGDGELCADMLEQAVR